MAFTVAMFLLPRPFSHVHLILAGLPLYVTEAFLSLWLVFRFASIRRTVMRLPRAVVLLLGLYLVLGTVELLRALAEGRTEAALRDYATFYYSSFLIVGADLVGTARQFARYVKVVAWSGPAIIIVGVINLAEHINVEVTTSDTLRSLSIAQGAFLVMASVGAAAGWSLGWRPLIAYVALVFVSLFGVLFAQSRAILLVLPVAAAVFALIRWPERRVRALGVLAGCIVLVVLVAVVLEATGIAHGYLVARLQSMTVLSADPNATWRLGAWTQAIEVAMNNPAAGMGLGYLDKLPYGIAPHNSLVSILYFAGVPGFVTFVALNAVFVGSVVHRMKIAGYPRLTNALLAVSLSWYFTLLVVSMFNVALEGPFLAFAFWVAMGVSLAVPRSSDARRGEFAGLEDPDE